MLLDNNIDGVVIATPAITHASLVEQALLAGKHVFVEKPVALELNDAFKVHDISQQRSRVLMVGHLMRYHPVFLQLKKLVNEDRLGKLQHIYSHRLNLGKIRREENILWSFAPHDVSMILSLTGSEPIKVSAIGGSYLQSKIVDVTTTHLSFPDGVNAHIFVSWLHPYKEQKLVIVAEKAMAVFDDTKDWGSKLLIYPHKIHWENGVPDTYRADAEVISVIEDEPLKLEAKHFIDCIRGETKCRTDSSEAISVLRVLHSAEKALKENRVINMTDIESPNIDSTKDYFVHDTACIDKECEIGNGTKIWHFSHVISGSHIGNDCVIGQNVMIGPDVCIGNRCKIQNNVSIYSGVTLKDDVFCGPSCVFTNVLNPRAEIERKKEFKETAVNKGVTIGANATILCGIEIGEYGFIAAGAVVTDSVSPYALMAGVPARQTGWVCRCGERLDLPPAGKKEVKCSICDEKYSLFDGVLEKEQAK